VVRLHSAENGFEVIKSVNLTDTFAVLQLEGKIRELLSEPKTAPKLGASKKEARELRSKLWMLDEVSWKCGLRKGRTATVEAEIERRSMVGMRACKQDSGSVLWWDESQNREDSGFRGRRFKKVSR